MFELLNKLNIFLSAQLSSNLRRLVFAALGGFILSLSLPAVARGVFEPMALLAWVGLIPLLILAKSSTSSIRLSIETIVFGMAYYLIALSWLPELHPLTWQGFSYQFSLLIAVMVWTIPSFFHSCLFVPVTLLAKVFYSSKDQGQKKNGSLTISDIVILAFLWTAIQYKLQFNLLGLSILSAPLHYLAYSQHHYLNFIQICNIIGTIGLEFLIVVVNLYLSNFFIVRVVDARSPLKLSNYNINQPSFSLHNLPQQSILGLSLAAILLASLIYSNSELFRPQASDEVSFSIAQANLSAEASRGKRLNAADVLRLMKEKTAELYLIDNGEVLKRTDILVWPEGSVPVLISDTLPAELDELQNYADIFVFGTYHVEGTKLYNSNTFVDYFSNGKVLQFYNKIKLVPFGEYTPWLSIMPEKFKNLAKFAIGSGFDNGSAKQDVISTTHGRIGTFVCFELLFPDLVRKQAANSELMINLNDLSWFKSQRAEDAFLAVAQFRAIENAQGLILASNRGLSTGIDAQGRLVVGKLRKSQARSVYNLYGW